MVALPPQYDPRRYECQREHMGTWCVVDKFTGRICNFGGYRVNRLVEKHAIEMSDLLNEVSGGDAPDTQDKSLSARRRWRSLYSSR